MNIPEYLKTIYLGDRSCKSILIDGWKFEVKIQIDCISRVRGNTWNYYTDEDIYDGFMVFEGVSNMSIKPNGAIPNGFINDISAVLIKENEYLITLHIDEDAPGGVCNEAEIGIIANAISLEDKLKPRFRIRD